MPLQNPSVVLKHVVVTLSHGYGNTFGLHGYHGLVRLMYNMLAGTAAPQYPLLVRNWGMLEQVRGIQLPLYTGVV